LLVEFYEVIHVIGEAKKMIFLVYDLILPCFVLFLLLRLMLFGFLVIGGTNALIIVEKIRFKIFHIFCEGNACANKLANLGFIHKKQFHWYNRLSSSLFLEFFINRYSIVFS